LPSFNSSTDAVMPEMLAEYRPALTEAGPDSISSIRQAAFATAACEKASSGCAAVSCAVCSAAIIGIEHLHTGRDAIDAGCNIPPCLIGMEACVGAHHLSRKLQSHGHDARLMPAKYVRPYSNGQKNDFCDAEAIAEAYPLVH
jgi:hypothetical protein